MVAKIKSGKNMYGALRYNELKVGEGTAICFHSNNFSEDVHALSLKSKLVHFNERLQLNKRTKTNTIHISLNFGPTEKLRSDKLAAIADSYLFKIGFGQQPYVAYEHNDAGHPHIHIVTTNIRENGDRIDIHNIGRTLSEKARQEIEHEFNLVVAGGRKAMNEIVHPADLSRISYGKTETKRSISKVVSAVVRSYRFTSIPELNAALKQFNVAAIQGSEGSMMKRNNGLLFSLLDKDGRQIGIPIKASSLNSKPTLKMLQRQFQLNKTLREPHKNSIRHRIDRSLNDRRTTSLQGLIKILEKSGIHTIVRRNDEGRIYGLTFVDNNTRCVFNGSDLGKPYTAKGIESRIHGEPANHPTRVSSTRSEEVPEQTSYTEAGWTKTLTDLMTAEQLDYSNVNPLLKKRKKRRRKSI